MIRTIAYGAEVATNPTALIKPEYLYQYVNYPIDFVYDVITPDIPDFKLAPDQEYLLRSLAENTRTSARSGHGVGKTSGIGFGIKWFLCTRPEALVPCTAPKADQLHDVLWTEIQRWLNRSRLKGVLRWTAERIKHLSSPDTWYAVARTARDPENLAGFHAKHLLFVVDEASGVRDAIFDTIEGALTFEDNRIVIIGNPTQIRGYFYDSHHRDKDSWNTLHFDSEKSPLVKPEYCVRIARKYGVHSDIYMVRVKGEFPKGNPESFIQLADVEAAVSRETVGTGAFELGVDVARFGDDLTAIAVRQGNKGDFPLRIKEKTSIPEVAGMVLQTVKDYRKITDYTGVVRVKVDDTGVGGGVTDILREDKENNIMVIAVNFGGEGDDDYDDAASKMYGEYRDQLPYISLPDDEFLIEEASSRRWKVARNGKIRLEPKDEYKKEYGQSPDRIDAHVLAFAKSVEKRRVWAPFSRFNAKHYRDYPIYWKNMYRHGAQIYVSIHQEKDLVTSLVACLWDGQGGHLYPFLDLVSRHARPDGLVPRFIYAMAQLTQDQLDAKMDIRRFQWYANKEMFGIKGQTVTAFKHPKDAVDTLYIQDPYRISLQPNLFFDKYGSIAIAGALFANHRITLHDRCKESCRQWDDWAIEGNEPGKNNIGLCMALCNIISLLHQWGKIKKFLPKLKEYSPEKDKTRAAIEKADKDGKLADYVRHHMGRHGIAQPDRVRRPWEKGFRGGRNT